MGFLSVAVVRWKGGYCAYGVYCPCLGGIGDALVVYNLVDVCCFVLLVGTYRDCTLLYCLLIYFGGVC